MEKRSKGRKLNDLLKFMRESSFEEGEMKILREKKAKFFRRKSERRFDFGPAQIRNKNFEARAEPWASAGEGKGGSCPPWPFKNSMFLDFLGKIVSFLLFFRQEVGSCPPGKFLPSPGKKSLRTPMG